MNTHIHTYTHIRFSGIHIKGAIPDFELLSAPIRVTLLSSGGNKAYRPLMLSGGTMPHTPIHCCRGRTPNMLSGGSNAKPVDPAPPLRPYTIVIKTSPRTGQTDKNAAAQGKTNTNPETKTYADHILKTNASPRKKHTK